MLFRSHCEVAGDYYYHAGYYYLAQNTPDTFEEAYDIINARVSYLVRRYGLRLTVFGDNLGDERYNLAQFHTDFGRRSEEHTSELQSLMRISYAVFCLQKKTTPQHI